MILALEEDVIKVLIGKLNLEEKRSKLMNRLIILVNFINIGNLDDGLSSEIFNDINKIQNNLIK
jgi:hypothetical protein